MWRAGRIKCQKVGNVVNPDEIVRDFGADALRLYEMFMGPLEATKPWSTSGVGGVRNFLDRCWRLVVDEGAEVIQLASQVTEQKPTDEQMRAVHRMLDKVTSDIESLSFNTAIAKMMEFVNFATPLKERPREMLSSFLCFRRSHLILQKSFGLYWVTRAPSHWRPGLL